MMNIDAKSNLAKLLATEDIYVEMRKADTASFNLKTRTLTIPNLKESLSNDVFDLFIGHEVGHALFTPFEGWHDSIVYNGVNKDILNVCEDSRIEKLIRRKFPGLKLSFLKAYKQLLDDNFFGVSGMDLNQLNLIDRINIHQKCGVTMDIRFTPIESGFVKDLEKCETFAEVIEVAKRIQQYMLENAMDISVNKNGEVSYELGDGDSDEGVTNDGESISFDDLDADTQQKIMDMIKSKTDASFREKEKDLQSKDTNTIYANLPEFDIDEIILDYKSIIKDVQNIENNEKEKFDKTLFSSFRKETVKVVSYLVKEFELRRNAAQLKRASTSKTGEINMDKIYSYTFNDDLFKRMSVVPNGKSHGLVLFLDWSCSMSHYMKDTVKQLLTLAIFCKKIQIPFEVYAFSDNGGLKDVKSPSKDGYLRVGRLVLMNLLSSKMTNSEFSYMANALLDGLHNWNSHEGSKYQLYGTPLNECIISAMSIVPRFQSKNKLQIVNTVFLTDGEGHRLNSVLENGSSRYSENIMIRDPKTKAHVMYHNNRYSEPSAAFLQLLKQKTDCNVIGFRIANRRDINYFLGEYGVKDADSVIKEFNKNKSAIVESKGFDEFYFLSSSSLDIEESELQVTSTTTRSLVKAFRDYNKSHFGSRIVLNRFIKMIS